MQPAGSILYSHFTKLWLAQTFTQIAQHLLNFALIIRVFELSSGTRFANVAVSLLILAFGIPAIFWAAPAGVYVDFWDRRRVLVVTNLLRAILVFGFIWVETSLLLVLILSFVIATITQFFVPAEAASIPHLVNKKQLVLANSLFVFTLYGAFIVGYSAAAPLIAAAGFHAPYWAAGLLWAAAALMCAGLPRLKVPSAKTKPIGRIWSLAWKEASRNWRTIRSNPNLSFPLWQLALTQGVVGVLLALAPALSRALLKVPLQQASHVLVIPAGIGMIVGVIAINRAVKHISKLTLIKGGSLILGLALTLLGLSGQLYRQVNGQPLVETSLLVILVAGLVGVLGFMNAWVSVAAQTMLQENSQPEERGRIFGALAMLINVAATLPILFAGLAADLFSVTKVVFVIGTAVLLFGLKTALTSRPDLLAEKG